MEVDCTVFKNNSLFNSKKGLNKKGVTLYKYNPFIFLSAPLIGERCSYDSMIEYKIIKKIKD